MNYRHYFPFVVEDDDDFVRRAFLKAGVPGGNVHRYPDGEGALADLLSIDVIRPSALLLDIQLPGMTGLSVLERVRACERLAPLPAFFLSGRAEGHFIATAHVLGARGYWVKPHGNGGLLEIVQGMLGCLDGHQHPTVSGNLLDGR
jgi:DNA-binding response OmpR family regulator